MNRYGCCRIAANRAPDAPASVPSTPGGPHRLQSSGRLFDIAGMGVAGTILALLPKCPLCLAAYLAVWTGVLLPLTTTMVLRASLVTLCVASLLYLTARFLYRFPVAKEAVSRAKDLFHGIRS